MIDKDEAVSDNRDNVADTMNNKNNKGASTTAYAHFSIMLDKMSETIGGIMYLKERVEELPKSINYISSMCKEQTKTIVGLQEENSATGDELAVAMNTICDLRKDIHTQSQCKLDDQERYSRMNNAEIVGVPERCEHDCENSWRESGNYH